MEASIYVRDKDGGFRSIGSYSFSDRDYEDLTGDWLAYLKGNGIKGGAYKCSQIGGAVAATATNGEASRTQKVLLLRFDDVVYIG